MKKRRNKIKKCGRTYVFERENTDDIIKLLKLFDAREIFIEIGISYFVVEVIPDENVLGVVKLY